MSSPLPDDRFAATDRVATNEELLYGLFELTRLRDGLCASCDGRVDISGVRGGGWWHIFPFPKEDRRAECGAPDFLNDRIDMIVEVLNRRETDRAVGAAVNKAYRRKVLDWILPWRWRTP